MKVLDTLKNTLIVLLVTGFVVVPSAFAAYQFQGFLDSKKVTYLEEEQAKAGDSCITLEDTHIFSTGVPMQDLIIAKAIQASEKKTLPLDSVTQDNGEGRTFSPEANAIKATSDSSTPAPTGGHLYISPSLDLTYVPDAQEGKPASPFIQIEVTHQPEQSSMGLVAVDVTKQTKTGGEEQERIVTTFNVASLVNSVPLNTGTSGIDGLKKTDVQAICTKK